jgi:hypothetical protein
VKSATVETMAHRINGKAIRLRIAICMGAPTFIGPGEVLHEQTSRDSNYSSRTAARLVAPSEAFAPVTSAGSRPQAEKPQWQLMTATNSPIYRWRAGQVEMTRLIEFEAALFEPAVIYPEARPAEPTNSPAKLNWRAPQGSSARPR